MSRKTPGKTKISLDDFVPFVKEAEGTTPQSESSDNTESITQSGSQSASTESSEPVKEDKTLKPSKKPTKKSTKKPAKKSTNLKDYQAAKSESILQAEIAELATKINEKLDEANNKVGEIVIKKRKKQKLFNPTLKVPTPDVVVYKVDDNVYTTIKAEDKKPLENSIRDIKNVVFNNENKLGKELHDELLEDLETLSTKVDEYKAKDDVSKILKGNLESTVVPAPHKDKPQMTVQNYIDELAQTDAFTIPEERLRQGLLNAIENNIIGLDKNKIDDTIDSFYSKSLLFNKKLKKIVEETPEEDLLEKLPPDVVKRLLKRRNNKQDVKNRKYKLFKKPPNEFHTESPATIPPHERDYKPPYGLNPLLLRGVRKLTNQVI